MTDEGEEDAVRRRGSVMNGVNMESGVEPREDVWRLGKDGAFRDAQQPELADEQIALGPEWAEMPLSAWSTREDKGTRWITKQGPGADCSVVAGLGVCMEHNRRWGTAVSFFILLYPSSASYG